MNIVGIIAEFNPFHQGHEYLIKTVKKQLHPDGIIVIMSGDFVQRGGPAIYDKYHRTRQALRSGADVVIELPVTYALSSAEGFAKGAVTILHELGVVNTIVFGTEEVPFDITKGLLSVSTFLNEEPASYQEFIKDYLKQGNSYPLARAQAFAQYCDLCDPTLKPYKALLSTANNILALEYTKAILKLHSPIHLHPIVRMGNVSAHAIRDTRLSSQQKGIYTNDFSLAFQLKYATLENVSLPVNFSKELVHRLKKVNQWELPLSQLILECKTKQYTHSRISRCFFRFLLGIDEETVCHNHWHYARILGFNKEKSSILKEIKKTSSIPVIEKCFKDGQMQSVDVQTALKKDIFCHNFYCAIAKNKYPRDWELSPDQNHGMVIISDENLS